MTPGAYILGCEGPCLSAAEAAFFAGAAPFGFILFARNIETAAQVRALCADLRSAVGRHVPIFIDQEGGRVQRLRPPLAREWTPPLDFAAAAGADAERALWLRFRIIAAELAALGIDGNCVPCADIAWPATHAFLRNRCLGTDAATVTRHARAVAAGTLAGGVLPVVKHLPGHGRALADSHHGLPRVDADAASLWRDDAAPFVALNDLPLAMTAHVHYAALDAAPATTSPALVAMIRNEIGFAGLLMTDDISMQALGGDVTARSQAALAAGCDLVLHCNGDLDEMRALTAIAGRMDAAGKARADRALAMRKPAEPIDIVAAEAELHALSGTRAIV